MTHKYSLYLFYAAFESRYTSIYQFLGLFTKSIILLLAKLKLNKSSRKVCGNLVKQN